MPQLLHHHITPPLIQFLTLSPYQSLELTLTFVIVNNIPSLSLAHTRRFHWNKLEKCTFSHSHSFKWLALGLDDDFGTAAVAILEIDAEWCFAMRINFKSLPPFLHRCYCYYLYCSVLPLNIIIKSRQRRDGGGGVGIAFHLTTITTFCAINTQMTISFGENKRWTTLAGRVKNNTPAIGQQKKKRLRVIAIINFW